MWIYILPRAKSSVEPSAGRSGKPGAKLEECKARSLEKLQMLRKTSPWHYQTGCRFWNATISWHPIDRAAPIKYRYSLRMELLSIYRGTLYIEMALDRGTLYIGVSDMYIYIYIGMPSLHLHGHPLYMVQGLTLTSLILAAPGCCWKCVLSCWTNLILSFGFHFRE